MGGVWKDLRGNCGFWDGGCRATGSGAVKVFTQALGWHTEPNKRTCAHGGSFGCGNQEL